LRDLPHTFEHVITDTQPKKGAHVIAEYKVILSRAPWSSITVQPGAEGEIILTVKTTVGESSHRLALYDVVELAEALNLAARDSTSKARRGHEH
jgi:hypothetical protein